MSSNVDRLEGPKLAGLGELFFLPYEQLRSLPAIVGSQFEGDLQLAQGALWHQLAGTIYSLSLDSETQDSQHGSSYTHELRGFFTGDSDAVATQLQRMQSRRFVVLVRDYDQTIRLVGDPLGGLLFSYKFQSGRKPGEAKGYDWRFQGITPQPALFYTGAVPVAATGGGITTPGGPSAGPGSGFVEVRSRNGRLLTIVPAGKNLIISSGFRVAFRVE